MRTAWMIALAVFSWSVEAQVSDTSRHEVTLKYIQDQISKGKQYTIVLLKASNATEQRSSQELEAQQTEHLKYLFSLKAQGKLPVFGPFVRSGELRGICIFNSADEAEVKRLIESDPHVKSGRLVYEIHPWFGIPGDCLSER